MPTSARGEQVNARRSKRNVHDRETREQTSDRRKDFMKRHYNDRAKEILAQSTDLKERHAIEWAALKLSYGTDKAALKAHMSPALKDRAAEIKTLFKPYWADMFKRHRDEMKSFEAGDRSAIGRIWTAAAAFKELALDGNYLGGFAAALSKEDRRNVVLKKHDRERAEMGQRLKGQMAQELGKMKRGFEHQFSRARAGFMDKCDTLKIKQDASWSEIRGAWKQYNHARATAFDKTQDRQNQVAQKMHRSRGRSR